MTGAVPGTAYTRKEEFLEKVNAKLDTGVAKAAFAAQREIKLSLNKPGPLPKPRHQKTGGRRIGAKIKEFVMRASRSGEPPRYRTKDLINSILAERVSPALWRVGSPMKYAMALEFGYEPSNLEPRPFLRPVMRRLRKLFKTLVFGEIRKVGT